ncbi:MAG: hypothetical protein OEV08_07325, partial [Nitrospira sp.]|nr:hypothetical protein [Nitrospira sp.]
MRQLAERLVSRGHSVTVATTAIPARGFKALNGVLIQEFAVSGNLSRGMMGDLEGYRQFVTGGAFDVVMIKAAQQWTFDALWPVLSRIPCRKIFIPCGFSCLYEPEYAKYFLELPVILKQFDHLIFYTSEYRDIQFARAHGLTDYSIIPNGASEVEFGVMPDPSFRHRYRLRDQDFLFLTVGSPARMKGHFEIAEAFALAEFSGHRATLLLNAGTSPAGLVHPVISSICVKANEYWRVVRGIGQADGLIAAMMHVGHGVMNKTGIRRGRYASVDVDSPKIVEDDLSTVIDRIHAQRNGKRVVWADLPRTDLVQAFLNSDLFVFASYVEYSPL